jgi:hypothetical protein
LIAFRVEDDTRNTWRRRIGRDLRRSRLDLRRRRRRTLACEPDSAAPSGKRGHDRSRGQGRKAHRRVRGSVVFENLFNQDYQTSFGFPGLPITARAGVRLTVGGDAPRYP